MSAEPAMPARNGFGHRPTVIAGEGGDPALRLAAAESRARSAEARAAHLEAEVRVLEEEVALLRSQLEAAAGDPEGWAGGELETLAEELSHVMESAEESVAGIVERAWLAASTRASAADQVREETRAELERLRTWRMEMDQAMVALRGDIEEARGTIDGMPERVRTALAPAAEAMAVVDAGMAQLAMATLPETSYESSSADILPVETLSMLAAEGDLGQHEHDDGHEHEGHDEHGGLDGHNELDGHEHGEHQEP
jgi:chromosome segregation ATPase